MLVTGCIYDHYPAEEDIPPPANEYAAMLVLRIEAPAAAAINLPNENMHSLRIIVLGDDNTVEFNDCLDNLGSGAGLEQLNYGEIRLIPTNLGHKKIYLIANEQSVGQVLGIDGNPSLPQLLNSQTVGSQGFENLMDAAHYIPDFDKNLVLSSVYDFDIDPDDIPDDKIIRKTFYLVHNAAKFDFTFKNFKDNAIQIDRLELSQVAENSYLMAHVGQNDLNKELDGRSYYWVDWLKEVVDATNARPDNPDNADINSRFGWITDYYLPDSRHNVLEIGATPTIQAGQTVALPTVYCAESSFNNHRYLLTIGLTDSADNSVHTFENILLDNLGALFRNTHVKVNVSLDNNEQQIQLHLKVGICPWNRETIDIPTFD